MAGSIAGAVAGSPVCASNLYGSPVAVVGRGRAPGTGPPDECVRALRRLRFEREQAAVQQDIDRLQTRGAEAHDREIDEVWQRRNDRLHQIAALASNESGHSGEWPVAGPENLTTGTDH